MTWSGPFTNEEFAAPGNYVAKNGVRAIISMPNDPVTVYLPGHASNPQPAVENTSVLLQWTNDNRNLLTVDATPNQIDDPRTTTALLVPSSSTRTRHGTVSLTFLNNLWHVTSYTTFGISLSAVFAVRFRGQLVNGLTTIEDDYNVSQIERTGTGLYTLTTSEPLSSDALGLDWTARVAGLPDENSADILWEDIFMTSNTEVRFNMGVRNKNGQFSDDDLVQNPSNAITIIASEIP